ncbi:hypothetical protein M5Y49_26285 [Escherichia coli]|nr:hypothetical protein [Escherichia coli]
MFNGLEASKKIIFTGSQRNFFFIKTGCTLSLRIDLGFPDAPPGTG